MAILRTIGAVVAGIVTAFVLVIAVEAFSAVVHPVPADFKGTQEEMCQHVANYPDWVLAAVVPMWGLTALLSTWIAGRIGYFAGALIVGLVLIALAGCNIAMLPYPLWFKIVQPIAIVIAVALGCRGSGRRVTAA